MSHLAPWSVVEVARVEGKSTYSLLSLGGVLVAKDLEKEVADRIVHAINDVHYYEEVVDGHPYATNL